ncbi:hypothetical protein EON80_27345, partial [bacterium]
MEAAPNATTGVNPYILGIDPGRQKTGLAIVDSSGVIVWRAIAPTTELGAFLEDVLAKWSIRRIALGHSTGSSEAAALIESILAARQSDATLEIVNERDSTLQARELYYEAYPPKGLWRLVPQSLQSPPI